ncbi:MAG: efflux RND transporter periplasmic adaptor subunit [Pseudomonadota bacterium]
MEDPSKDSEGRQPNENAQSDAEASQGKAVARRPVSDAASVEGSGGFGIGRPSDAARYRDEQPSALYRGVVLSVRASMQFVIMAAVLIGATFLMFQLEASRKERPKRAAQETVYTIEAVVAEQSRNQPILSVYGEIVAARTLNLTALVPGEIVYVNPKLRIGARLSKGERFIEINPFNFQVALDEAAANLREARAMLSEAKVRLSQEETGRARAEEQFRIATADFERAKTLAERGTFTQRDVEQRELTLSERKAAFQTSEANINVQKAQIEARSAAVERWEVEVREARQQLENTVLKAPFDAVVQTVDVELRQTVTTSQALVTLFEADTLDARFVLSDGQYGRLIDGNEDLIGRKVSIDWTTGSAMVSHEAEIDRIGAEILSNRGGVGVFARIDLSKQASPLRPGAFVTVNVPDRTFDQTFRLPETAVFEGDVVYVVGEDNRLEKRDVDIAVYDRDTVIVKGGLESGDLVNTTQIAEIGEGLLVRVGSRDESAIGVGADGEGGTEDGVRRRAAQPPGASPRG